MRTRRAFLLGTLIAVLTGSAAAQPAGGSNMFFGIFDTLMINATVNSWTDLLLYIVVPYLGFYGILRFLTRQTFRSASSTSYDDTTDSSARLVAIAVAGGLTMYMGGLSIILMGFLGIVGVAWAIWTITGKAAVSGIRTGRKVSSEASENWQGLKNWAENLGGEVGQIEREEEEVEEEEEETEQEEEQGVPPEKIAQEINVEESEIKEIISETDRLEKEYQEIIQAYRKKENQLQDEEDREEQDLEEVEKRTKQDLQDLKNRLQKLRNEYAAGDAAMADMVEGPQGEGSGLERDLQDIYRSLEEFHEALEYEQGSHEDLGYALEVMQDMRKDVQELDTEENVLEKLGNGVKEELVTAENIAQQYGDENSWNEIKEEEGELKQLLQEIEKAAERKQKLESELQQEIERLKEERQYDQEELQEIQQITNELQQEGSVLDRFRQFIQESSFNDEKSEKLLGQISRIENMIQRIENEAEQIENSR